MFRSWLPAKPYAFVIMPIGDPEMERWYADLRERLSSQSLDCFRSDELLSGFAGRTMLDGIHELIRRADIVIAEVTHDNRNVLYELGFAVAAGKDPIVVATGRDELPTDLQGLFTCDRSGLMRAVFSRMDGNELAILSDFILPLDTGTIYVLAGPREPDIHAPLSRRTYGDYIGVKRIPGLVYRLHGDERDCELLHCRNADPTIVYSPNNIFSIGSGRNNKHSTKLMAEIQSGLCPNWFVGVPGDETGASAQRAVLARSERGREVEAVHAPSDRLTDVGLILRGPHPQDRKAAKQVVVLAGPSSLGTAGACEAASSAKFAAQLAQYLKVLPGSRGGMIADRSRPLWVKVKALADERDLHLKSAELMDAGFCEPE